MKRRHESKDLDDELKICFTSSIESMICLLTETTGKSVYYYIIEKLIDLASTRLPTILHSMIAHKVKGEIIYDVMLELDKHDFGDQKDNTSANIFANALWEKSRKSLCLLQSFELFWRNPLFFGVTRNYNEVSYLAKNVPVSYRPNILATIYKTFRQLYINEPASEDKEFLYTSTLNIIRRKEICISKQIKLLRLNVPLEFLDTNNEDVKNALKKMQRSVLFQIFNKYKNNPLCDFPIIDKCIMPFL
jgi:hypothetical protein